jgi:hypothetical protein
MPTAKRLPRCPCTPCRGSSWLPSRFSVLLFACAEVLQLPDVSASSAAAQRGASRRRLQVDVRQHLAPQQLNQLLTDRIGCAPSRGDWRRVISSVIRYFGFGIGGGDGGMCGVGADTGTSNGSGIGGMGGIGSGLGLATPDRTFGLRRGLGSLVGGVRGVFIVHLSFPCTERLRSAAGCAADRPLERFVRQLLQTFSFHSPDADA